jgi:uncharacterized protein
VTTGSRPSSPSHPGQGVKPNFIRTLGEATLRFRWAVILINIAVLAFVMSFLSQRGKAFGDHIAYMKALRSNPQLADSTHKTPPPIFDADYHVWFDKNNPDLLAFDEFQRVFAKEELGMISVSAKDGDIFTNKHLATLRALTDRLWTVPYANRVDGMVNFNYTTASGDDLVVEDFITHLPYSDSLLRAKKAAALADPTLSKFLVSKDARMTQISLRVIAPDGYPDAHLEAKHAMDSLVAIAMAEDPNLEFKMGGTVVMTSAFNTYAMKDFKTLVPLMFVCIIVILTFLLRSFWGTALPMGLLFTSILFPIALFVGVFGMSLNNASANVVQILVTIAIADSVHMLTIFFQGLKLGMSKRESILYTFETNFMPCLITWINTAVGFYSLLLQDVPPFQDLGLLAGTGTMYAFLASVFTLPALLSLLPFKPKTHALGKEGLPLSASDMVNREVRSRILPQWPVVLVEWVDRWKRPIVWGTVVTTVASIILSFFIVVDSHAVKYFGKDTEFRQATEHIDAHIIGTNPFEFGLNAGSPGGVYDPAFLKKMERFQSFLMSKPEYQFTYAGSIVDVVKRINQTMHGGDPAFYVIPDRDSLTAEGDTLKARNLIAQYILLYTLSLPQGMELTNQVNLDNSKARVTAFQKGMTSTEQARIAGEINAWLKQEMPETGARSLGVPIMFANMMNLAMPGMLKGMGTSLLLITLLLIATFRSWKAGLLSLIPNVWPIVVMYGLIGLSGYMVNLSVAVVGMITLGIAVDDTVHFMLHYLHAMKEGMTRKQALVQTFQECGAAILFTSIILIAGFSALTLSDFAINVDLGMFSSLVWALALVAEFTMLPAVILWLGELKKDAPKSRDKKAAMANQAA